MVSDKTQEYLLHVQILFRHGDRTSFKPISNDRFVPFEWPFPIGTLTDRGRARAYDTGRFLAQHYKPFLRRISHQDVVAKSSIVDRCIESTELVRFGLFSSQSEKEWSEEISLAAKQHPIPVHTKPIEEDNILVSPIDSRLSQVYQDNHQHPKVEKMLEEHKDFVEQLTKSIDLPPNLKSIFHIYDSIICEKYHFGDDYALPSWMQEEEDVARMIKLRYDGGNLIYGAHTPHDKMYLFRTRVKPFLQYSLNNFEENLLNDRKAKLELLGTHDYKLLDLFSALEWEHHFPEFCSTLIFELWHGPDDDEPHLKIQFIEPTKGFQITPFDFQRSERFRSFAPSHGETCPISKFREALHDIIVDHDHV